MQVNHFLEGAECQKTIRLFFDLDNDFEISICKVVSKSFPRLEKMTKTWVALKIECKMIEIEIENIYLPQVYMVRH